MQKKRVSVFASAMATGLLAGAIAGKPVAADTCNTRPNLQAGGGHWSYHYDRATHQKCWYQQGSRTEVRSSTARPTATTSQTSRAAQPKAAASAGLNSWLGSVSAAVSGKAPTVVAHDEEARDPPERPSRWRLRAAQREDRAQRRRAHAAETRGKQVDSDSSQTRRAAVDARRQDVDPELLRLAREDQDSFRKPSSKSSKASAPAIAAEDSRATRGASATPDGSRTRGINPDNSRAAAVQEDDATLNRFDWDDALALNNALPPKSDRLQPKAVSTEAPAPSARPQAPAAIPVRAGAPELDQAQREALFQEFLRWQERQGIRYW
jgi:hypothetical protein